MSKWFCGVTSAPRRDPTVDRTIQSLRAAGYQPHVFAEPGTQVSAAGCTIVTNPHRLGVWHNWVQMLNEAYESQADLCVLSQDDIEVHPDTKDVVEDILLKVPGVDVVSIYTPRGYTHQNPILLNVMTGKLWGNVGIAYRREVIEKIHKHPLLKDWRGVQPAEEDKDIVNSDTAVGRILADLEIPCWFPSPSFSKHTSRFSTIPGHGSNDVSRNRNASWLADFDKPLWSQIFKDEDNP